MRAERKKHKPHFMRQNAGKKIEVGTKYRKPRGYQSKMRRRKAGYSPMPSQGYRAPVLVRGKTADGTTKVMVHAISDLEKINVKTESAQIGSTVGAKKRIQLLTFIQEKKIPSLHDVAKELSVLQSVFTKKTEAKKEEKAKEEKAKEEKPVKEKKEEKKEQKPPKKEETDKEDAVKKEQEKILTDKKTAM